MTAKRLREVIAGQIEILRDRQSVLQEIEAAKDVVKNRTRNPCGRGRKRTPRAARHLLALAKSRASVTRDATLSLPRRPQYTLFHWCGAGGSLEQTDPEVAERLIDQLSDIEGVVRPTSSERVMMTGVG